MLVLDSILISIPIAIILICFIIAITQMRKSPIIEMKLLTIFLFLQLVSMIMVAPILLLSSPDHISTIGMTLATYSNIPNITSFYLYMLVLLFPNFKLTYKHVTNVIILAVILTTDMIFSILQTNYKLVNGSIQVNQSLAVQFFSFLNFLITITLLVIRFIQINKLKSKEANYLISARNLIILPILIFIVTIMTIVVNQNPNIDLPSSIQIIPISLIFLIIMFAIKNNKYFFFLIPVKLYATIVTDQNSGVVLYSQSLNDDKDTDVLLGGLLTALDISLKEAIQTKKHLEELSFGDKVVHIAPGKFVTTLFIISEKTLMTKAIAASLTKSFEKEFRDQLEKNSNNADTSYFSSFEKKVNQISPYFAY